MGKKSFTIFILFFICLCAGLVIHQYSQSRIDFTDSIEEVISEVHKWEHQKTLIIVLTCAVGILGVVAATIQGFKAKWTKTVTAIIGCLISALTVINDRTFNVDHHTLSKRINKARELINDIRFEIPREPEDPAAHNEWLDKIRNKIREFYTLSSSIPHAVSISDSAFSLFPVLHAEPQARPQQEPSWVKRSPKDNTNVCFIGIGESPSIEKAKQYSRFHAYENAWLYTVVFLSVSEISDKTKLDAPSLAREIIEPARVSDVYFFLDKRKGLYRYYTLLELNRKNVLFDFKIFTQSALKTFKGEKYTLDLHASSFSYYERTIKDYEFFSNYWKSKLSLTEYEKFMEARLFRKGGNLPNEEPNLLRALDLLSILTEAKPQFVYGWFELAFIYDEMLDRSQADESFAKVSELAEAQRIRDSSFYNLLALHFFRNRMSREAVRQLEKSLEVDKEQPLADALLKAVSKH